MAMQTAFMVLTDPTVFFHIVEFQSDLPYAVLSVEPEAYAAEANHDRFRRRTAVEGASLLHHALLTDNVRLVNQLFRLREQPHCPRMLRFALDDVLELVCKRGTVKHLKLLHKTSGVSASWPSNLLKVTLFALENIYQERTAEELATFHDDQKSKAKDLVPPRDVLIAALDLRDLFEELLAANAIVLRGFARVKSSCLNVSLFELLLRKYPAAFTRVLVEQCTAYGNLEAVTFIHDHESELPEGLFTTSVMNAAAKYGHLDVVRFLHQNRTEGCTQLAIDDAVKEGHLDVVKFLHENRTEGFSNRGIAVAAQYGGNGWGDLAMAQYLVNDAVKYVRSVWAKRAIASDDPVEALRAAVIHFTDVDAFEQFHKEQHPVGCTGADHRHQYSLLELAIQEQNDEIAACLVNNCEHDRASIGFDELLAAGSDSRPLNLELLDFLMAKRSRGEEAERDMKDLLRIAAEKSNLPFVKALLDRGVPCSDEVVPHALYGELFEVGVYLMDAFPELITKKIMHQVAYRGEHAYLFKLHASHPQLWDSSIVSTMLCDENADHTWHLVRSLYERSTSVPLDEDTPRFIWKYGLDDALLFMWLVWQDPKIAPSLSAANPGQRLHLYSRLRALVPSLFVDVPTTLPWCRFSASKWSLESSHWRMWSVRASSQPSPATWAHQLSLA